MFNLGFSELLIIGVIALLFIGPKELPEIAKVIGRMLNELKRATGDLQSTILHPQEKIRQELSKIMEDVPIKPPEFGHKEDADPYTQPEKPPEKRDDKPKSGEQG